MRGGFAGELAAIAPQFALLGCAADKVTLYGRVAIASEKARVRRPGAPCKAVLPRAEPRALRAPPCSSRRRADKALAAFEGDIGLRSSSAGLGTARLASLTGDGRFSWRDGGLTATYDLAGTDLTTGQAAIGRFALDGSLRTRRGISSGSRSIPRSTGRAVRLGRSSMPGSADAEKSADGTLLESILHQDSPGARARGRAGSLAADVIVRRTGARTVVVGSECRPARRQRRDAAVAVALPARLRGRCSGQYSGGFATGGQGLPRIAGRIEQRPASAMQASLSVAPYAAGSARVAIPRLALNQQGDGTLGFTGEAIAERSAPGGHADELVLPLTGSYSPDGRLALWSDCTEVRFAKLQLANLALDSHRLTLCPPRGADRALRCRRPADRRGCAFVAALGPPRRNPDRATQRSGRIRLAGDDFGKASRRIGLSHEEARDQAHRQ